MNIHKAEVLYDLTWNLAKDERADEFPDSRTRFFTLLSWTEEFSTIHAKTDWDKVDYLETVDTFYDAKVERAPIQS